MADIIDGKSIAEKIRGQIKEEVAQFQKKTQIVPGLATVLVGQNPASQVYVKNKNRACQQVGMFSKHYPLSETISQKELLELLHQLNHDPAIHGILVQLPLPNQMDSQTVLEAIDPAKDVDGFHPVNMGKLLLGKASLKPCTPLGIMKLLESLPIELKGKNAVVIGRSNIVGKPVALLLLATHATVTICHSRTQNIKNVVRQADVVVAAVGVSHFVKGDWIKKDAVVIDVGINRLPDGKLVGDVDFEAVAKQASFITPVPGGVGPMTIAMLLANTLEAAKKQC